MHHVINIIESKVLKPSLLSENGPISRQYRHFWCILVVIFAACNSNVHKEKFDEGLLRNQVDSTMSAYLDALSKHDGERIVSYYLNSPDFEVVENGKFYQYQEFIKRAIAFYSGIRDVSGGFSDFHTAILGPEAALISGSRNQTTVDTSGFAVRRVGSASWVWVKREGRWSIIHINTNYSELQDR
jgi:ketosteroid isomerase-like protein